MPAVVGWLRAGAAAVCGVDQELPRGWLPPAGVPLVDRVLCWAQRARLTGELRLLEGTRFQGVAVFQGGELQRASFCWLTGVQALAEMVAIEGADVRFSPTPTKELPGRVVAPRVDGLARAPRTLEELSHATGLEAGEVTAAALELLRRGVLSSR